MSWPMLTRSSRSNFGFEPFDVMEDSSSLPANVFDGEERAILQLSSSAAAESLGLPRLICFPDREAQTRRLFIRHMQVARDLETIDPGSCRESEHVGAKQVLMGGRDTGIGPVAQP